MLRVSRNVACLGYLRSMQRCRPTTLAVDALLVGCPGTVLSVFGPSSLRPPAGPLPLEGFVLRLPDERDVDALVRFGDDPDTAESQWLPIPSPCPRAEAKRRLRSAFGSMLVIADAAGDLAGVVSLGPRGAAVELAYGVAPQLRNRGIATAALGSVSGWCLEQPGVERVELRIAPANLASRRVAAKAGFECLSVERTRVPATGEEHDDLLYVIRGTAGP